MEKESNVIIQAEGLTFESGNLKLEAGIVSLGCTGYCRETNCPGDLVCAGASRWEDDEARFHRHLVHFLVKNRPF